MDMIPVVSSNLSRVGFEQGILVIEFKSGGRYRYMHVPEMVFKSLLLAESKGKFFDSNIKDKYPFQKIG
jgi:hypothetical protein